MDNAAFLARYPEFAPAGDLVDTVLAEQLKAIDPTVFGDSFDDAHGALTAHALWLSPFGITLRLDSDDAESKYLAHYKSLEKPAVIPLKMMVL